MILFPIDIRLKKCVTELFPKILTYCPGRYKTQIICDEAIDDCLATLKFIPDWFVRS